jgi:CRISPR/Cas system-associated endoribonuclease Cas2
MNKKNIKKIKNIDNDEIIVTSITNKKLLRVKNNLVDDVTNNNLKNNKLDDNILNSKISECNSTDNDSDKINTINKSNSTDIESNNININEKKMDNNYFLQELIDKQLKNVDFEHKLSYSDMKRICKNLKKSIFNKNDECAIWGGYITNNKNGKQYINFYFKKKKVALHRLLYINYIGNVNSSEYLKLSCTNSGKCCSINHLKIANSKENTDKNINCSIINNKKNKDNKDNKTDKYKTVVVREKVDIEI